MLFRMNAMFAAQWIDCTIEIAGAFLIYSAHFDTVLYTHGQRSTKAGSNLIKINLIDFQQ